MTEPTRRDRYEFDIDEPHPNADIEGLRRYMKQALAEIRSALDSLTEVVRAQEQHRTALLTARGEQAAAREQLEEVRTLTAALRQRVVDLTPDEPELPPAPEPLDLIPDGDL